jgi:hypothetical protein
VSIGKLASTLEQQMASNNNDDGAREDAANVHAENRYQVNYEKGSGENPMGMRFETNDDDGTHA